MFIQGYAGAFTIDLPDLEDENYTLVLRARDTSNNVGVSEPYSLIIDKFPPLIGDVITTVGPYVLTKRLDGIYTALEGLSEKITLSAIGGPQEITIIPYLYTDGDYTAMPEKIALAKNPDNGLWTGTVRLDKQGFYQLHAIAQDGAGNIANQSVSEVLVVKAGRVLDTGQKPLLNATVELYILQPKTSQWALWDSQAYGQKNPQQTDEQGRYELFVPAGTYYLRVTAAGLPPFLSEIFTIEKPMPINALVQFQPTQQIGIGPFQIPVPDFLAKSHPIELQTISYQRSRDQLLNEHAPDFTLPTTNNKKVRLQDLRGSPTIISFMSTWNPASAQQITILDKLIQNQEIHGQIVLVEEPLAKAEIFQKRGGYKTPFAVDTPGKLIGDYQLSSLPIHFILDETGVIKNIVHGLVSEQEVKDLLSSY